MEIGFKLNLLKKNNFSFLSLERLNIFDRFSIFLSILLIFFSLLFIIVNDGDEKYVSHVQPINLSNIILVILTFLLIILSLNLYDELKKTSFVFKFIGVFLLSIISMLMAYNVQLTPFAPIDVDLYKIDLLMGFNQNQWLAYIHKHYVILKGLELAYESLDFQVILLPIVACFIVAKNRNRVFFI
ncbi:hypothetical protein [Piscirickettsia litoralis]|uniref:hypothetical protein n=1 Tax=Piscirickettsia litoralis TaxID=1891921 RepID=UPI001F29D067|nr:hypothetical protein [Piscirickettsia litoralis]